MRSGNSCKGEGNHVYRFSLILLTLTLCAGSALAAPARAQIIPESGTLALFGSGLIGLAALIRRHFSE
jgi:threonine dehydrogenase-like Zn-dependent dehydrogenase